MKLYAKISAHRGGREAVKGDDTRLLIDLNYGNQKIGTIGFYSINSDKIEGYRLVFDDLKGFKSDNSNIIIEKEIIKGKTQKGESTL